MNYSPYLIGRKKGIIIKLAHGLFDEEREIEYSYQKK
jgi:hypothetical protein